MMDDTYYIYEALQEAAEGIYEKRFEELTVEQKVAVAEGTLVALQDHYAEVFTWPMSHDLHAL